jgi:hypothetical protein
MCLQQLQNVVVVVVVERNFFLPGSDFTGCTIEFFFAADKPAPVTMLNPWYSSISHGDLHQRIWSFVSEKF